MKKIDLIYHYKKVLINFDIIINGQSKQPSEIELHISTKMFFFFDFLTT